MWTDPGWVIYLLEVRIWFWSSRLHDLQVNTVLYLSFSTLYSSSLWTTDTIVLNKPLVSTESFPPQIESNKWAPPPPSGGRSVEDLQ